MYTRTDGMDVGQFQFELESQVPDIAVRSVHAGEWLLDHA